MIDLYVWVVAVPTLEQPSTMSPVNASASRRSRWA